MAATYPGQVWPLRGHGCCASGWPGKGARRNPVSALLDGAAPAPPRHVPAVAGHGLSCGVKASPLGTATDATLPSRSELGCLWGKNC